jgi:hypothetical protein
MAVLLEDGVHNHDRGRTLEVPGRTLRRPYDRVESARLLVNQAAPKLKSHGLSDEQIRRLADEFIARDRGEAVGEFVTWAQKRERDHGGEPPPP